MKVDKNQTEYYKVSVTDDSDNVIAMGYLYLIWNDGHDNPYGYVERIYIEPDHRSKGIGSDIVQKLLDIAKEKNCYKVIATSRHSNSGVHKFYEKFGFTDHGKSFRIDLIEHETSI